MKYINLDTQHGLIRIQLLQNPFTDKYVAQLQKMHSVFQTEIRSGPPLGLFRGMDPVFVQKQTTTFINIIDELNAMGLEYPYVVTPDSLLKQDADGQELLNKLHRSFTTAHKSNQKGERTLFWNARSASNFIVTPEIIDRVLYLTEIINYTVHDTEFYMNTPRKTTDRSKVLNQIEVIANVTNDNPHSDLGPYNTLAGWFTSYTEEDYTYFSDSSEFDVWVGRDILGKDFIHAYYDCDDPTCWDVTGQLGYSGKIAMDVGPTVKSDIIKSDDFRAWLDQHRVEYSKKMGGMPVGTIIEGKELLKKFGMPNHDITVSFE
jgi:hypothetical protein